jgi:DNA polymerase-3 subunit delta'
LARAVNCLHPDQGEGCGRCQSCRQFAQGSHPNLLTIDGEEGKIKIDQIRQVIRASSFKKAAGKQVVLIKKAEKMTLEAANCLLRTLEDPPPHTIFVLTTVNLGGILPTVASRCLTIRLGPLAGEEVMSHLRQQGAGEEELADLTPLARGRLMPVQELKREHEEKGSALELLGQVLEKPSGSVAVWKVEDNLASVLVYWAEFLRDIIVMKEVDGASLLNPDRGEKIRRLSVSAAEARRVLPAVIAAQKQLAQNANPQLVWDVLLLSMAGSLGKKGNDYA